ncbi:MAG: anthranilate phosphoribosyltransferase [Prosthecobacter sp.]|nr:anthranilate phosphoribosyltransferase [Prosthecobacter sp.]
MEALTQHLATGAALSPEQIAEAASLLVDAAQAPQGKADFLRALARKGETPQEIAGFVQAFLKLAVNPGLDRAKLPGPMLDVVGTGGDKLNLFNISTTAMFILAAGGVCVTKHGNRGITGKCGGADVLEAMGIRIDLPVERVARGIEAIGLGFFFAPLYHPAFKAVGEARKILAAEGQRSIFNLLGPLLNPAKPDHQLIGVFDQALTRVFGEILLTLGRKSAWVVHGTTMDGKGMDEVSTLGPNYICKVTNGALTEEVVDPQTLGFAEAKLADLAGGDAPENASTIEGLLGGAVQGPKRDIAVLNAAAGFVITGKTAGLREGLALAVDLIDRGAAHSKMRALQDWC